MEFRELTYWAIALRIVAAVILGGILGLERGLQNRPAGLRTYILVCVCACLVMMTNVYICQVFGAGDPVRMGAQVVSGIGFLGAGTIVVTRRSQIRGLTTAAGLWAAAGVGLALGVGFYEGAVCGGLTVFVVLTLLQKMDNRMRRITKSLDVYIELSHQIPLGDFLRSLRELDIEPGNLQLEREMSREANALSFIATLRTKQRCNHAITQSQVEALPGVQYLEVL